MIQDEMARMVAERLFAPRLLLIYAVFLVYDVAVGYASWRVLLRLPDFAYRREMLWGARWMSAIVTAVFGVALGVTYCGASYTDYPLTSVIVGGAVFTLGMHQTMLLLPMRTEGWLFCLTALGARLRGKQLDLEAWVTKRVRQYHNPWIKYGLGRGVQIALLLTYAYLVLAFTYPVDRDFARGDREQRIADQAAADVRERLQEQMVAEVRAYGPIDLDSLEGVGTASQARGSLREILAIDDPPRAQKPFHLVAEVTPDTSVEDAQGVLEQVRAALEERQESRYWQVTVKVKEGEVLARGEYP